MNLFFIFRSLLIAIFITTGINTFLHFSHHLLISLDYTCLVQLGQVEFSASQPNMHFLWKQWPHYVINRGLESKQIEQVQYLNCSFFEFQQFEFFLYSFLPQYYEYSSIDMLSFPFFLFLGSAWICSEHLLILTNAQKIKQKVMQMPLPKVERIIINMLGFGLQAVLLLSSSYPSMHAQSPLIKLRQSAVQQELQSDELEHVAHIYGHFKQEGQSDSQYPPIHWHYPVSQLIVRF